MKKYISLIAICCSVLQPLTQAATPAPELLEKPYLFEITRHLYRWYLDESDAEKIVDAEEVLFLIRGLSPELDSDDESLYAEVAIPALNISAKVKKADYAIEELGVEVKSDSFKIINVGQFSKIDTSGYEQVATTYAEMKAYGIRTQALARFPEGALLKRLRLAARAEVQKELEGEDLVPQDEVVVHFSALSPVANELWVFWEAGRLLMHFASDIDLANASVWEQEKLAVRVYNIDEQVVVSLGEVAGSNAYLTRDQVGRALFNCVVQGRRLVLRASDY